MEPTTVIAGAGLALKLVQELGPRLTELRKKIPPEWRDEIAGISDKVYEIRTEVDNARDREVTLNERCRELNDQLKRVEDWKAVKAGYARRNIDGVVTVFVPKDGGESPHWLCANCFEDRRKSYLQGRDNRGREFREWKCGRCGATLEVCYRRAPGE